MIKHCKSVMKVMDMVLAVRLLKQCDSFLWESDQNISYLLKALSSNLTFFDTLRREVKNNNNKSSFWAKCFWKMQPWMIVQKQESFISHSNMIYWVAWLKKAYSAQGLEITFFVLLHPFCTWKASVPIHCNCIEIGGAFFEISNFVFHRKKRKKKTFHLQKMSELYKQSAEEHEKVNNDDLLCIFPHDKL